MASFGSIYVGYIVPASTLLPIVAGLIDYQLLNRSLRTLLVYLCIALLINIAGITMAGYNINNLPLLHFYTIFELVAVMFYYKYAFDEKAINRWTAIISIAFPLLCIVNFTFFQSIYQFNTYTRPLEAILIIIFSILYLARHASADSRGKVTTANKWVAGGFLIYFCSSFFQFIFSNVVSHYASPDVKKMIWNIHATFVLIMYIFFFIAIRNERGKG